MPLAALDFLRRIETARSARLSGFDRLAIDNASRGARLAFSGFARLQQQLEIDPLQHASVAPTVEIMLYRRIRRKLTRHLPPFATGPHYIEQRLDTLECYSLLRSSQ